MKKFIIILTVSIFVVFLAFSTYGAVVLNKFSAARKAVEGNSEAYAESDDADIPDMGTAGYKAEITYNNIAKTDGTIMRSLVFRADLSEITGSMSEEDKVDYIEAYDAAMGELALIFARKGLEAAYDEAAGLVKINMGVYDSLTDLYIASGRNGYDNSPSKMKEDWGFFFVDYSSEQQTFFSLAENMLFISSGEQKFFSIGGFTKTETAYVYNYGTKYSTKFLSSDADEINSWKGLNVHRFVMNSTNTGREIMLYQHVPNAIAWYALVILATAAAAAAVVILYKGVKTR
jgi:hypothetical protein